MRPLGSQCRRSEWEWIVIDGLHNVPRDPRRVWACWDEWVEPGQLRAFRWSKSPVFIIGPCEEEEQDAMQHDRTVKWWALTDGRLGWWRLHDLGNALLLNLGPE